MSTNSEKRELALPAVFTTQSPYPLPSQKFMIPASWRRYQLSQLVNKALSLAKPVPFDFLVRGEILRTSLGEWCSENGVGEEETLEIEYFESMMPPQKMASLPHEDWVSSVSCQKPGYFFTASYDGHVRIFNYSQSLLDTVPAHNAPAVSISIIPPSQDDTFLIASASLDLTARLIRITPSKHDSQISSQTMASLHLHSQPLTSVSSNLSGTHLLTASADTLIGVWNTSIPEVDEVSLDEGLIGPDRKKRRKAESEIELRPKRKSPIAILKSHTARVSKADFSQGNIAISAGFDSTVRTWDVENSVCTHTISASSKPFLSLAVASSGQTVLVSSTDRTVTHYDLRTDPNIAKASSLASLVHPATPSCIATPSQTSSQHQLITGAYDGVVRLWDLRSVKSAVTSVKVWEKKPGGKKVLSVDWAGGVVGIGGEGGMEVWRIGEGDFLTAL